MANFDRFERLKSRLNNERRKLNESGFRYEPDGEMSLTSNFNDIMPFVSVYERVVMKEFPEAGSIECALGGNDLFDAMSDGELNDETAVDWIVDKVRDNCEGEECDEVEVNESKLNEGTANFYGNGGADWLPLLVFCNSDDIYADLHREADDLYSEIDDDDERREKIDAYIDTYFDERLGDGICGLTDDDIENLENELYLFNEKMRARGEELAYGEGSDDDAQYQRGIVLKDLKVELKPGYYEGVQLFCDIDGDESFLTEDDKNELIEFFKKIKKDFNLTELAVAYRASNGETGYSIVDDEVKDDGEVKEESLKEGAKAVSIEKKDGEVEDTLVFDSYDEAHEYLELLASAKKYPYHEIVEDSYETDNGLLLIGYANYNEDDKLPEDEIEHILVKYSTKEQNDANEKKEDELGESKKHSDDEINDAYFGAMRFFSKGGKDPEEFLAKHPKADADAVRSAFDNFKAGNKWKELKKEKEDSFEEGCDTKESFEDEIKKFEVCYFVKEDEHDEIGQWETIGQYDTYEEAKEVFDDARHNGLVPGSSDGATIIDQICIYEREDDGSQKRIECDESMHESFEDEVKSILKPRIIDGGMIKPFGNDEKLPRGFRFLAGTSGRNQRGYVKYKGNRYWYEVDGDDVKVVRESIDNPYVAKPKEDGKVHINKNAGNPKRNAELFNQSMGFAESLNEEDDLKLPKEVEVSIGELPFDGDFVDLEDSEISDLLSDYLSDKYGFCHKGFKWKGKEDSGDTLVCYDIEWDVSESLNEEEERTSFAIANDDRSFVDGDTIKNKLIELGVDWYVFKDEFFVRDATNKEREEIKNLGAYIIESISGNKQESLNEEEESKKDDKSDISNEFGSNVKDEWDAIEGYNTLESEIKSSSLSEEEKTKLLSIIDDIRSEEYRHVGQLQQALKTVTDDADKINDGEKEAESQEDSHEHEEEHVDEVTDDIIDTEISEVEKDAE